MLHVVPLRPALQLTRQLHILRRPPSVPQAPPAPRPVAVLWPCRPVHSRTAAAEWTSLPNCGRSGLVRTWPVRGMRAGFPVQWAGFVPVEVVRKLASRRGYCGRSLGFSLEGVCDLTLPGQPLGSRHGAPQCHRTPRGDPWPRTVSSGGTLAHRFPSSPPVSRCGSDGPPRQAAGGVLLRRPRPPWHRVAPRSGTRGSGGPSGLQRSSRRGVRPFRFWSSRPKAGLVEELPLRCQSDRRKSATLPPPLPAACHLSRRGARLS